MKLMTIGVYGFDEAGFFQALQSAGVDTFCDIRLRRGVRGHEYAFANATHLQQRLAELGIRYIHVKELAPTAEIRAKQFEADHLAHVGQRSRQQIGPAFAEAYRAERLATFDAAAFIRSLGEAKGVCLFCVERDPEACHRSLVAAELERALGVKVEHILPL